jgi:hypothetical protein
MVVGTVKNVRRVSGEPMGLDLIEAVQASPYRDIDLEVRRAPMPIRNVSFSRF